jgi:hypothetical protein
MHQQPPPCFGSKPMRPTVGDVVVTTPARHYILRSEPALPAHLGDGCWRFGSFYYFNSRAAVGRTLVEDVLDAPVAPGTCVSVEFWR